MKQQTPETAVTEKIIQLLKLKGYTVKKIYNGGVPARASGGVVIYRKKNEEYKGIPDLLAYNVSKGRFLFIEAKREGGKVKPDQRAFIDSFNACKTFEARVVNNVEQILDL